MLWRIHQGVTERITGLGKEVTGYCEDHLVEEVALYLSPERRQPLKKSDDELSMEKENSCQSSTGPPRKLLCLEQSK